jgi:hypothetical protein
MMRCELSEGLVLEPVCEASQIKAMPEGCLSQKIFLGWPLGITLCSNGIGVERWPLVSRGNQSVLISQFAPGRPCAILLGSA